MASLVELTVETVVLHTPVVELLAYIEYLPTFIRHQLFRNLSSFRLREMEMAWEAAAKFEGQEPRDGFDPLAGDKFLFDRETQREWEDRLERYGRYIYYPGKMKGRPRSCRHVFWEKEFTSMVHLGHVDGLMKNQKLFVNVVRVLKLPSGFICKDNAKILLALRYLQSLQILLIGQQNPCWETMRRLVKGHPHLTELKFRGGSLSDSEVTQLYTTLTKPVHVEEKRMDTCRITALAFASVDIQPEGYRMLVALVGAMPQLLLLRVKRCIQKYDKKLLVNAALRLPALTRLFLGSDEIEDDAFVGLVDVRKPLALRHLRLRNNNLSFKTVEAICRASMDGVLKLEWLDLSFNKEIHDTAMHALTPMLASPVVGSTSVLTHLDLSGCRLRLEGVTSLLQALGHNKTLTDLNVGFNYFDHGFGDILADFLLTNSAVTHLKADYVHLTQAGVTVRLLTALESNFTLTSLSLAENQLHCDGASAILGALIVRARVKPFALVDLSRNQIELDGLKMIADIFESFINYNGETQADSIRSLDRTNGRDEVNVPPRKRHRVDNSDKDQRSSFSQSDHVVPVEELRLEDNSFDRYGSRKQRECTTPIKSIQRCVGHLYVWLKF